MSEADVVYSDVRFTASKQNSKDAASSQTETTYDEVKSMKVLPEAPSSPAESTYAKVKPRAKPPGEAAASSTGSKVRAERVALLVLSALLAAAAVALCFVSLDNSQTKKKLDEIQATVNSLAGNSTGANSSVLVKPTCVNETNLLQTCLDEKEELRKNLTAEPGPTCDSGWDQRGRRCYYFSTDAMNWTQSRSDCKGRGADLVLIDSEEEQSFLTYRVGGKISNDKSFWIGLTDSKEEDTWLWVDDSPLNKSLSFWYGKEPDNWTGGNPADPAGEDCARMGLQGITTNLKCWFDKSCAATQRRICEKAAKTG